MQPLLNSMKCISASPSASIRSGVRLSAANKAKQARPTASQAVLAPRTIAAEAWQSVRRLTGSALAGALAAQILVLPGTAFAEDAAPGTPQPAAVMAQSPPSKEAPPFAPTPAATVATAPAESAPAAAPAGDNTAAPETTKPKAVPVVAAAPKPAAPAAPAAVAAAAKVAADEVAMTADSPSDVYEFKYEFRCTVKVEPATGDKPSVAKPVCTSVPMS